MDVWPVVGQFHLLAPDWRRIVGMAEPSVSRGNGRHQQTHGMVDDPIEESLPSLDLPTKTFSSRLIAPCVCFSTDWPEPLLWR